MLHRTLEVIIQFPALDRLVAYLEGRATAAQQKAVDELTAKLSQSTAGLDDSVKEQH